MMGLFRGIILFPILVTSAWTIFVFVGYACVLKHVLLQARKEGANGLSCLCKFMVHVGWRLALQAGMPICLLIWLCMTGMNMVPATVQEWAYEGIALLVGLTVGASLTYWNMAKQIETLRKAPPVVLGIPNLDDMTTKSYVDHLQGHEKQKKEEA